MKFSASRYGMLGLDHGRDVGRDMRACPRGHGERAQLLGFDVRHVLRQRVE